MGHNRSMGNAGESVAAVAYERAGWAIADRNWRTRDGEVDLVVVRGGTVAFCEVKTRSSDRFGGGAAAVTPLKQAHIRRVAMAWLSQSARHWPEVRFDVAVVSPGPHGWAVELIEAAF